MMTSILAFQNYVFEIKAVLYYAKTKRETMEPKVVIFALQRIHKRLSFILKDKKGTIGGRV